MQVVDPTPSPESGALRRRSAPVHWPSALQFGLSLLAALTLWGVALSSGLLGVIQNFTPATSPLSGIPYLLMAGGTGFSGFLLLPSAGFALARLLGRPVRQPPRISRYLRPSLLIFLLPVVLLVGNWVSQNSILSWWLLPIFHILGIGLPILWLTYLGLRGLSNGSPQRTWGIFGSGLVLGPGLILIAEVAALFMFVILGVVWISSQPGLTSELTSLAHELENAGGSPEATLQILLPYLTSPGIIFSAFAFGAVIVPLIEEAIKPIGVWLLIGRSLSPAEGFAAGVLSGAGYALFESLALASNGSDWGSLVFARIGTGVIHTLNTGLIGWALVLAWRENRYLRLGATYLLAVIIHGLWNGLAILTVITGLTQTSSGFMFSLSALAPYILVILAISAFVALLGINRRLAAKSLQEIGTPPEPDVGDELKVDV